MEYQFDWAVKVWLIIGTVFIISEVVIPGAIVIFLGIAALIVGLSLYFDFIGNWIHALTMWFIVSLVLIIALRSLVQKYVGGDSVVSNTDEDIDAFGEIVEVIETIDAIKEGRISFRGTTWVGLASEEIEKGSKAKIVARDNTKWIVEKV